MDGYILDTSVLSAYLDGSHQLHGEVDKEIQILEESGSLLHLSAISLAELEFGMQMARAFGNARLPTLEQMVINAGKYMVLDVTRHTSIAYSQLKTNLAKKYLAGASRRDRRRWVEDWVDRTSGQKLQIDENDLWICSQAKERDLIVLAADVRMKRISDADSEVRLRIIKRTRNE